MKLHNIVNDISVADIMEFNIADLRHNIKQYKVEIQTFKTFNILKYDMFDKKLKFLANAADFLDKLRKSLFLWKKDKNSFEAFKKLNTVLRNGSNLFGELKSIKKLIEQIKSEINKFIDDSIVGIELLPNKNLLKKCDNLASFIIVTGEFGTGVYSEKLSSIKNKITIKINNRCNSIFGDFQEAKSSEDLLLMKKNLTKMLNIAPEDSKYFSWAKAELKKL